MPPPPPPSASYNLVIENSSSEEETDDDHADYHRWRNHYNNMNRMVAGDSGGTGCIVGTATSSTSATAERKNHGRGNGNGNYLSHKHGISSRVAATTTTTNNSHKLVLLPPQDEMEMEVEDDEFISMQVDEKQCGQILFEDETMIETPTTEAENRKKNKKTKNTTLNDDENDEDDDDQEEVAQNTDMEATTSDQTLVATTVTTTTTTTTTAQDSTDAIQHQLPKISPRKSISFGTVSVEQYARTLGTHVVPLDGGWPLGLSNRVVVPIGCTAKSDCDILNCPTPSLSPSQCNRGRNSTVSLSPTKNSFISSSPVSTASPTTSSSSDTSSPLLPSPKQAFTIDDFEARKQIELQQRYIQLILDQRRRKFEKEWERKHMNKNIHHNSSSSNHHHNTRRNKSFGSGSGGGGKSGGTSGGRNRCSGSMKLEMSTEEREELERILNLPVTMPTGDLETRPFDYKKKICHILKQRHGDKTDHNGVVTEEEELYHDQGGRNPLFTTLTENSRRKILLRDDHLMDICQVNSDDNASVTMNNDEFNPLDPTDTAITQHIQHELETLRIQRSDPANLGCSCRKLHVFLPFSTDKSHHKKKGSHRRMPERKVCEELRRRGLLNKSNENMSREKMEILLHDTVANEPCCWGNDCPCVKNGIGCQADTCSCWHASHDVVVHGASNPQHSTSAKLDEGVEVMKSRCGNVNGMYIVNFEEIAKYRKQHVTAKIKVVMEEQKESCFSGVEG